MIPKIIHYCWLSNDPVPDDLQKCMKSWEKYLADYKFVKWDLSQFDINSSIWTKEAFENKKYAFAADYIRLYALYTMGGIYLDMDVEVIKPYDDLLKLDYFISFENSINNNLEMAAFGAKKGCDWIGYVLDYYKDRHFVDNNGNLDIKTLPLVTKSVLQTHMLNLYPVKSPNEILYSNKQMLFVLPYEYFSPKSYITGKCHITSNTYSIHQFSGSWLPVEQRLEMKIWQALKIKKHPLITWHLDKWLKYLFNITR